ncbi:MAG: heme exporter protein CcmD [Candidatus Pelagibacter sp. TMED253]|nr:MAG: heme exporter protein CcmD [Candidatus Pelagibacter sp. TMED253]|tara:strand:+ start:3440 stop:3673 length:234 start_codon:yes stop_codon:yes gene_type:complete
MIQNLILMNGYGLFVWLSFAITFVACAVIYYKTYKTLKKYEKDFAKELEQLSETERKLVLEKSKVASRVLASYNKSI